LGVYSLGLKADGSIVGWGENEDGQANPPDGNDFVAIAAGYDHSLALAD
jgi:alpha-tubulin suppressor-like RCC1 family protein